MVNRDKNEGFFFFEGLDIVCVWRERESGVGEGGLVGERFGQTMFLAKMCILVLEYT